MLAPLRVTGGCVQAAAFVVAALIFICFAKQDHCSSDYDALSAMNRSVSQTAKVLGIDAAQVKTWAYLFKSYLSRKANPPKGQARVFGDDDVLVLAYVCDNWGDNPDLEAIRIGLNQEDYRDERFHQHLYMHTPLLQEPPDDLDETWRHGILLNGGKINDYLELARNYRSGAEALLDLALESGETHYWACPVLFTYRHTLELYLKLIGQIQERTHSLKTCVEGVEKLHGEKIGSPLREWILELDKIDPSGLAFRYSDVKENTGAWAEHWVDFVQLKFAMSRIFDQIDHAIIGVGGRGKPVKRRKGPGLEL
jgi:hypothetical protein